MGAMSAANLTLVQKFIDKKLEEARRDSIIIDPATYGALALVVTATGITTA